MPWKNGRGVTVEIAVSPAGATVESFDWRVSTARVEAPGPFSRFDGVDRTIAVIDGEALVLTIAGEATTVSRDGLPFRFPADVSAVADLPRGAVGDLNVMSRRGVAEHTVERHRTRAALAIGNPDGETLILAFRCGAAINGRATADRLAAGDALLLDRPGESVTLVPEAEADLFLIRLGRLG